MKPNIYFDYAAATPLDPKVLRVMTPYFTDNFYNASATYNAGRSARKTLEDARSQIAQTIGARPGEILFTAGGTEANNLAIAGVMRKHPGANMLISAVEHPSVTEVAKTFNSQVIPVDTGGLIDVPKTLSMINDKTVLVSVMLVNHEVGVIQPIKELVAGVKAINRQRIDDDNELPLLVHTDAAQSVNTMDVHVARLGVDLMSLNGGKIYGPKQTGALYVRSPIVLQPLILGGGQEQGLRSGTENVAGAVGLALAIQKAQSSHAKEKKHLEDLRNYFIKQLKTELPEVIVNGPSKKVSPHLLNLSFPGVDNERLMIQLDEAGVQVAVGSACSASKDEPSPVLSAMGIDEGLIRGSLRFSFGRQTTSAEIDTTIQLLKSFYRPTKQ